MLDSLITEKLPVTFDHFHLNREMDCSSPLFQLVWPMDFHIECFINKKYYKIETNQMLLVQPNMHIRMINHESEYINCIRFHSAFLSSLKKNAAPPAPMTISSCKYSHALLTQLSILCLQPAENSTLIRISCLLFSLINEFLLQINEADYKEQPATKATAQKKYSLPLIYATRYMKKHMTNPDLSLYEIASAIGYNPNYFCQEFSNVFSISPIKYLNNLRINLALKYLEESDHNVQEICKFAGIRNPNTLSAMVKNKVGMTPSEFRRNCKVKAKTS